MRQPVDLAVFNVTNAMGTNSTLSRIQPDVHQITAIEELELTVVSILVFNLLLVNLVQIVTPIIANWIREREQLNGSDPDRAANISSLEEELLLQVNGRNVIRFNSSLFFVIFM